MAGVSKVVTLVHGTYARHADWTQTIWRCWQDHQPYDPSKHGALQKLRATTLT